MIYECGLCILSYFTDVIFQWDLHVLTYDSKGLYCTYIIYTSWSTMYLWSMARLCELVMSSTNSNLDEWSTVHIYCTTAMWSTNLSYIFGSGTVIWCDLPCWVDLHSLLQWLGRVMWSTSVIYTFWSTTVMYSTNVIGTTWPTALLRSSSEQL